MIIVGFVLAVLAAALHVFIFYLESIAWRSARARAVFGTTPEEAEVTRSLAFNQGFYNLFLAVLAVLGTVLAALGSTAVGAALTLAGVGSMLAAALVLFLSSAQHRSAAIKQGAVPLLAVIVLVIGLLVA
ncbi:DUF1304 domain-containing protein [Microlunatus sp. GCM10028923]|uniref:DUF1304 domain-containing protein n=1 Tax=Microlunatus sp. GCM10028923 TaxID=3273400 RepID=UPI003611A5DA